MGSTVANLRLLLGEIIALQVFPQRQNLERSEKLQFFLHNLYY